MWERREVYKICAIVPVKKEEEKAIYQFGAIIYQGINGREMQREDISSTYIFYFYFERWVIIYFVLII